MITRIVLSSLLLLALILDSTLISLPLLFGFCILLYILYPDMASVVLIFLAGLAIDILRMAPIGSTSFAMIITCGFIYLYRNTFELRDLQFVVILPFVFAYIYAALFNYNANPIIYLLLFLMVEGLVYYFGRNRKLPNISMIHNS